MDVLKLLSRGTKKTATKPVDTKPISKQQPNPQLYNDPTRGVKRKRNEDQPLPDPTADEADDDVDFFAPRDSQKQKVKTQIPAQLSTKETKEKKPKATQTLDDDEVRRLLEEYILASSWDWNTHSQMSLSRDFWPWTSAFVKQT